MVVPSDGLERDEREIVSNGDRPRASARPEASRFVSRTNLRLRDTLTAETNLSGGQVARSAPHCRAHAVRRESGVLPEEGRGMATRDRGGSRSWAFSLALQLFTRPRVPVMRMRGLASNSTSSVFPWLGRATALGALAGLALGAVSLSPFPADPFHATARVLLATLLGGIFGAFVGMIAAVERRLAPQERAAAEASELWDSWVDEQDDAGGVAPPVDTPPPLLQPSPVAPERAPVRPRVISADGDSLPLDDEIWPLVKSGGRGAVRIWGGPGAGKMTALRHLAALLPAKANVVLLDRPEAAELASAVEQCLVIYTSGVRLHPKEIAAFGLALWGNDEVIEYLLAVDRNRCASVMARLKDDIAEFDQMLAPELWKMVLDRMLADQTVTSVRAAIRLELAPWLRGNDVVRRDLGEGCLESIIFGTTPDVAPLLGDAARLLRHRLVRLVVATEHMATALASDDAEEANTFVETALPRDLIEECGPLVAASPRAIERLKREVTSKHRGCHALSASLLHAAHAGWIPDAGSRPNFAGAYLSDANWPGVDLSRATLTSVDLARANLEDADLQHAVLTAGVFGRAILRRANMEFVSAKGAQFTAASLSQARARKGDFRRADFEQASLEGAWFRFSRLDGANIRNAQLASADLTGANLEGAQVEGADFTDAEFDRAKLRGLDLSAAQLTGARFQAAHMEDCKFIDIDFAGADFEDAILLNAEFTGSRMPNANFLGADLRLAKLADVQWPGACLRDANLRGAQFRMGTTRSGLVGSPVACEGSRTGFYTDDYQDRDHLPPEEIRKANLCGANLRGADIEGADFYLVDLRGAQFSPDQAEHFRRCGAILDRRD